MAKNIHQVIDRRPKATTANSRLPQWGLTWLNQVQCFYQHLCLVDSEVLPNPPLRQAAKRWQQAKYTECKQRGSINYEKQRFPKSLKGKE